MNEHPFLLTPTDWVGEGKIQLSMVDEQLAFTTKWTSSKKDANGHIQCLQEMQIKGLSEGMQNQFSVFDITPGNFIIELENIALGKVVGKGLINDKLIAWEFRSQELGFEGFEFYERQANGDYLWLAEYATKDQLRTVIQGKMWKRS